MPLQPLEHSLPIFSFSFPSGRDFVDSPFFSLESLFPPFFPDPHTAKPRIPHPWSARRAAPLVFNAASVVYLTAPVVELAAAGRPELDPPAERRDWRAALRLKKCEAPRNKIDIVYIYIISHIWVCIIMGEPQNDSYMGMCQNGGSSQNGGLPWFPFQATQKSYIYIYT